MIHVRLYHEVIPGDTMLEITRKYDLSFAMIINMNPDFKERDVNNIHTGELIRIQ